MVRVCKNSIAYIQMVELLIGIVEMSDSEKLNELLAQLQ